MAGPLTHPLVWDNSPRQARHRLTLYAESVRSARTIVAGLRFTAPSISADERRAVAEDCHLLADLSRRLAERPRPLGSRLRERPAVANDLLAIDDAAPFRPTAPFSPESQGAVRPALTYLHSMLQELSLPPVGPPPGTTMPREWGAADALRSIGTPDAPVRRHA